LGKCQAHEGRGQFSNTDNMALVGVVSTQLLHRHLVARPIEAPLVELRTLIEH
jgi:asparagine synthase (glutamine-hydrolysing)